MHSYRQYSVIPPYILRRIIDNGSELQQRCARQTLTHVQTLMAHSHGKVNAPLVTSPGELVRDIYDAKQKRPCPVSRCATKVSRRMAMSPWMKPTITLASRTISSGRFISVTRSITRGIDP